MSGGSIALVTPSYAADFERCRLLCDSMDAFVSGHTHHYILVADNDAGMFAALAGSKRTIVTESDILPSWLHPVPGGLRANSRKMWLSFRTLPMRGWHVQQLRRIAIANHVGDDGLLYCDSDMLFVKSFDTSSLWRQDALRLYKISNGITPDMSEHKTWCNVAAQLLGHQVPQFPADDFINNLVSWRRETALQLCETIEHHTGRHWIAAIGRNRTFSECQIYGAHVGRSEMLKIITGLVKTLFARRTGPVKRWMPVRLQNLWPWLSLDR